MREEEREGERTVAVEYPREGGEEYDAECHRW